MQGTGRIEKPAYLAVAGFGTDPAGCPVEVPVTVVVPSALFRDGLEDLRSSYPAFFGCLRQISVREFPSGLRQEMLAGLLIPVCSHSAILLLLCS